MKLIPIIDVNKENCAVMGESFRNLKAFADPVELSMRYYFQGFKTVMVMNISGSLDNSFFDTLNKVRSNTNLEIISGGGILSKKEAELYYQNGADYVTISSLIKNSPDKVGELCSCYPGKIIGCIDIKKVSDRYDVYISGGEKSTEKGYLEFAQAAKDAGIRRVLVTSIDSSGLMEGFDPFPGRDIKEKLGLEVMVSGGISSIDDIWRAYNSGLDVVAGSFFVRNKKQFDELYKEIMEVKYGQRDKP